MRKLKSLQCSLLTFLVLIFIASCSKESTEIEDRIRVQAEKNNAELSYAEIKKTAAYLIEWGRPDFYEEQINVFLGLNLLIISIIELYMLSYIRPSLSILS